VSRWSKVSIAAISMGQEIGITPLQLAGLISSMANDGVYVAPRITAATIQPQTTPQRIAFHPVNEHRVISAFTAAEMRQMMQRVVLHGTGTKARLIGYSSAGKTGTGQKVDPATHAYSHTKYVASFAGFAPINNPSVTIVVVLDSAVGLHQGGQISAPVFSRIAQQVLEYLHTPHDLEIPANRQALLARAKSDDKDLEEGSPDHPGEEIDVADASVPSEVVPSEHSSIGGSSTASSINKQGSSTVIQAGAIVPASMRAPEPRSQASSPSAPASVLQPAADPPANGTVVLDVEQGGIVVPSFAGKSVRSAIELAETSGLDLEVVGNGLGQTQLPPAGSHVATGTRITVTFGR
jgi:cell division protein FtsI (penicillin-binding protein 3)